MEEKLKKHCIDEKTGISYTLRGDYYLPDLIQPRSPQVGRYGRLHLKYLKENKNTIYTNLLITGKLADYAEEIDRSAKDRQETIIRQMAKQQGVNEKLKATDQMKWVGLMNNIRDCADEIVLKELIYT